MKDRPLAETGVWVVVLWNIFTVLAHARIVGMDIERLYSWNLIAAGLLSSLFLIYIISILCGCKTKKLLVTGIITLIIMWCFHLTGALHEAYLQILQILTYLIAFFLVCKIASATNDYPISSNVWKSVKIFFIIEIAYTVTLRIVGVFKGIDTTSESATYAGRILGPFGFLIPTAFLIWIILIIYQKSHSSFEFFQNIEPDETNDTDTFLILQPFPKFSPFIRFLFKFRTPGHIGIKQSNDYYFLWPVPGKHFKAVLIRANHMDLTDCLTIRLPGALDLKEKDVIGFTFRSCYDYFDKMIKDKYGKGIRGIIKERRMIKTEG